jgi:F0F1-type ATP synthase assembly protein I
MKNNQKSLKEKIQRYENKKENGKNKPENINFGIKIGLDLVSTIVVAVLIGLGIDKIFSTHPIFFIIFLLLGVISGFYSIIKSMSKLK